MCKILQVLVIVGLTKASLFSQVILDDKFSKKEDTRFFLSTSYVSSYISFYQNTNEIRSRKGLSIRTAYNINNFNRLSLEYYFFPKFNSIPKWENVKAVVFDLNLYKISDYVNESFIRVYTITGLSFTNWKGNYVGVGVDYKGMYKDVWSNMLVTTRWLGVNLGLGLQRDIRDFSMFTDFRFRFTRTPVSIGISDFCYQVGVSYNLTKLFRKPQKRYDLKPVKNSRKPNK